MTTTAQSLNGSSSEPSFGLTGLKAYFLAGGNLLAGIPSIDGPTETGLVKMGLDDALAPFGLALDDDVVLEQDASKMMHEQIGAFIATPKPHAITQGLIKAKEGTREPPRVLIVYSRSLHHVPTGAPVNDLLATSPLAFGVTNVTGAARWPLEGPDKTASDIPGPLVIAMASEGPKLAANAAHGARAVVFGSASVFQPINWSVGVPDRGAAFLVENAISWLASKPAVLDVPDKPSVASSIRLTDESRSELWRYVLLYMPISTALLGLAVGLRRRSTEGRKRTAAKVTKE